jgi:hypothetical protein
LWISVLLAYFWAYFQKNQSTFFSMFGLRGYIWIIWHIHGDIFWKLRAHEKNRKCWFVDLSFIFRKNVSQNIFDHYTDRYSIVTRGHLPNCKNYLLPDGISNWAQIFTDHATEVCQSFIVELFLIGRRNNSRTPNNRRFFTISDFKIYLLLRYICKMAQILIKYS